MKAVILCGGQGSRIRDASESIPKPMLPIGGKPILWHIMKVYAAQGIKDFVLCLGYKGWVIREFFLNYLAMTADFTIKLGNHQQMQFHNAVEECDWTVTLADTGEHTMTGGRVWRVRQYLEGEDAFHLTYGDGVADVQIAALQARYKEQGLIGTLTGVHPSGRYGEMATEGAHITKFWEKKPTTTGRINGGFMILDNKKVWKYFNDDPGLILERDVLPPLVRDGQLGMYEHDGYWQCMDTLREYNELNGLWEKGDAPWKIW